MTQSLRKACPPRTPAAAAALLILLAAASTAAAQQTLTDPAPRGASTAASAQPEATQPEATQPEATQPNRHAAFPTVTAASFPVQPSVKAADASEGTTPSAASAAQPPAGTQHDAMKMHGHWVIEVKRKDGTIADRREFENHYIGGYFMGLVLSGFVADIDPAILLSSATDGPGSWCTAGDEHYCAIFNNATIGHGGVDSTPSTGLCPAECYTGLTSTLTPGTSGGFASYVLSGNITAVGSGTFDTVSTSVGDCYSNNGTAPTTISSANCYTNAVTYDVGTPPGTTYFNNTLTSTTFSGSTIPSGPVTVTAGETLAFTVTITFS